MGTIELIGTGRLTKDLRKSSALMTAKQARYLADLYSQIQEYRKATDNQERSLAETEEPNEVLGWFSDNFQSLEEQIKRALGSFTDASEVGKWSQTIVGVGPVISASLLAYIDIEKAPTAGHIWRFAGLDSTQVWLGVDKARKLVQEVQKKTERKKPQYEDVLEVAGVIHCQPEFIQNAARRFSQKDEFNWADLAKAASLRPWNQRLRTICWNIGESFVKQSGHPKDTYGKVYLARKAYESRKNEAGDYREQAEKKLADFKFSADTQAKTYYEKGMLPPAHLHSRAKRYAVKLFLAHWHHVAFETRFGKLPPKPYVLEHLGHTDYFAPPNWPM